MGSKLNHKEKRIKTGTGLSTHTINYELMKVEVDLSGNYEGNCFRNDASIFFFAANSYRQAYVQLGEEIENRFMERAKEKDIEHLVLPYLFCFRHFIELELKAFLVVLDQEPPRKTHALNELLEKTSESLKGLLISDKYSFKEDDLRLIKSAMESLESIKQSLLYFMSSESAPEYYRYIFSNNTTFLEMKNPVVSLEYKRSKEEFSNISNHFNKISINLRQVGVYVYQL